MKRLRRTTAIVLSLVLVLALAFSTAHILLNSSHECIGEECRVCHVLRTSADILGLLFTGLSASAVLFMLSKGTSPLSVLKSFELIHSTPISLKEKMTA